MGDCVWCSEPIREGEPFELWNGGAVKVHRECAIRSIAGSVGHQRRTCSCFGGSEEDPVGATRREAAIAAARMFDEGRRPEPVYYLPADGGYRKGTRADWLRSEVRRIARDWERGAFDSPSAPKPPQVSDDGDVR